MHAFIKKTLNVGRRVFTTLSLHRTVITQIIMKVFSKNEVKRVINSHLPGRSKIEHDDTEILVYLTYLVFLQELADESRLEMQLEGAAGRQMARRHVIKAGRTVLKKYFR